MKAELREFHGSWPVKKGGKGNVFFGSSQVFLFFRLKNIHDLFALLNLKMMRMNTR